MCEECYMHPCHPRCPNSPYPKTIYRCVCCWEGITDGEEYIKYGGDYYHADCVKEMSLHELGELFDFRVETAGECEE